MKKIIVIVVSLRYIITTALVLCLGTYTFFSVMIEIFQKYLGIFIDGGIQTFVGRIWDGMNGVMSFLNQYDVNSVILGVAIIIGLKAIEIVFAKLSNKKTVPING